MRSREGESSNARPPLSKGLNSIVMLLDHPSLEPFEPIVGNLVDCAFGDALRGLASAGFQPGDEWHTHAAPIFKAACLPGFKKAQDAIATNVLNLEHQIAA